MATSAGAAGALPQRRSRGPAALHALVVTVVVALIAAIALHAVPPSPPQIAEFAPQPQKQIKQAPQGQSSKFGNGANGAASGSAAQATPTPQPGAAPSGPPPQFHCYVTPGSPPRQTPDPQSPPCVTGWYGASNGNATYKGVTQNTICIGDPSGDTTSPDADDQALANYFNSAFELYNRHIVLVKTQNNNGNGNQSQTAGEQADAIAAANAPDACGAGIFASMSYVGQTNNATGWTYQTQLAKLGVISVAQRPMFWNAVMNNYAPYIWQYNMAFDDQEAMLGQVACAQLAGANAVHAGDANLRALPRKFGILIGGDPDLGTYHSDANAVIAALAQCGVKIDPNTQLYDFGNNAKGDPRFCSAAALQMKGNGVTTIISITELADTAETGYIASQNSYHPEWLVPTYSYQDIDWWVQNLYPQDQRADLMGLSFNPKQTLPQDDPFFQALSEAMPGAQPPPSVTYSTYRGRYKELLLIASGIQMAGPDLTPQTFAAALQHTAFPNPDTPIYQGHVGFQRGHAMTDDAALMWYSNQATPPYSDETGGAWCYVGRGRRAGFGDVPATRPDPFLAGACDSGSTPAS